MYSEIPKAWNSHCEQLINIEVIKRYSEPMKKLIWGLEREIEKNIFLKSAVIG